MDGEALILGYLDRLDVASHGLPESRRSDLRAEVEEHIEAALDEVAARDEVTIRNVLERLGPPEEIVAADLREGGEPAQSSAPSQPAPPPTAPVWGTVEILAILGLTIGGLLLPFVGPIIGLLLVWMSRAWTTMEKTIATGIVLVLLILPVLLLMDLGTGG
jgi:uncharacterized membrane protein